MFRHKELIKQNLNSILDNFNLQDKAEIEEKNNLFIIKFKIDKIEIKDVEMFIEKLKQIGLFKNDNIFEIKIVVCLYKKAKEFIYENKEMNGDIAIYYKPQGWLVRFLTIEKRPKVIKCTQNIDIDKVLKYIKNLPEA